MPHTLEEQEETLKFWISGVLIAMIIEKIMLVFILRKKI
jgi:hypothetical protein